MCLDALIFVMLIFCGCLVQMMTPRIGTKESHMVTWLENLGCLSDALSHFSQQVARDSV